MSSLSTFVICTFLYVVVFMVSLFLVSYLQISKFYGPVGLAFIVDVLCTIQTWIIGTFMRNTSVYDPYWSVAPLVLLPYWLGIIGLRSLLVGIIVCYWGIRLTYNCFRRWGSIWQEDFRYTKYRQGWPWLFPFIDFFGLQMMPTVLVFLGCMPLYPILTENPPLSLLDCIAVCIAVISQYSQTVSDNELWEYLNTENRPPILKTGMWALSRHPNYFGEITFWWCLYLFVLAVDFKYWWMGIGALLINLLFLIVSVPLMDARSIERRPGYKEYMNQVNAIVPWHSSVSKEQENTKKSN